MGNIIIAIDPGNIQSGFVVVEHDGREITRVLDKGKADNDYILTLLACYSGYDLAIEMIASYGMAVGAEVFDTCVWVGRFWQEGQRFADRDRMRLVYRMEEKLCLCRSLKATDSNIAQALVDRYAPGQPRRGKGTVKNPGFFHGFSKDIWSAMAVAVTYFDKYVRGIDF